MRPMFLIVASNWILKVMRIVRIFHKCSSTYCYLNSFFTVSLQYCWWFSKITKQKVNRIHYKRKTVTEHILIKKIIVKTEEGKRLILSWVYGSELIKWAIKHHAPAAQCLEKCMIFIHSSIGRFIGWLHFLT